MKKTVVLIMIALLCAGMSAHAGYVTNSVSEIQVPLSGDGYDRYLSGFDYDSSGNIIAYTGKNLVKVSATGAFLGNIYEDGPSLGGSFVKVDRANGKIYFGEASTGTIRSINIDGSGISTIATINNNYDMVIDSSGRLLVSASEDWTTTDLWAITLGSGGVTTSHFGSFNGAAGALALAADGSLYYGTAGSYGTPAGAQSIYSWSTAALNSAIGGGAALAASSDSLVIDHINNVAGLAIDGTGALYFATAQGSPSCIWKVADGDKTEIAHTSTSSYMTTLRYNPLTGNLDANVGFIGTARGVVASVNPVPEPSSCLALASLGMAGLAIRRRRSLRA